VVRRAIRLVAEAMNKKKKGAEPVEGEEGEEAKEGEEEEKAEEAPLEEEEEEEDGEMTPRTLAARVDALTESITYQSLNYCRRGTLE
jgi:Arc/MetJ-type ribon-helix-helix transcriptional regulator